MNGCVDISNRPASISNPNAFIILWFIFSKTLVGIGGGDVKQADGNKGDHGLLGAEGLQGLGPLSAGDGAGVSCAAASEPDFSKYRYVEGNEEDVLGRSALVWDVEQVVFGPLSRTGP